jgi:hypothetical protein
LFDESFYDPVTKGGDSEKKPNYYEPPGYIWEDSPTKTFGATGGATAGATQDLNASIDKKGAKKSLNSSIISNKSSLSPKSA